MILKMGIYLLRKVINLKAEVLAEFFICVFTEYTDENYDNLENINVHQLSNVDKFKPKVVNEPLKELIASMSSGPAQVQPIVLSNLSDRIHIPQCRIYHSSFTSDIVPN